MKKVFLLALTLIVLSCGDDDDSPREQSESTIAMVQFSGAVAADGCGWLLEIDSETYKPINLPEIYEQEELFILSEFELLAEREACGLTSNGPQKVNIKKLPDDNVVQVFWNETQCSDPWQAEVGSGSDEDTAKALAKYLVENNIEVFSIHFVEVDSDLITCRACNCPSGKRIAIRIASEDLDAATELGFISGVCVTEDSLEDIEWLKSLKDQFMASAQPAGSRIIQYQYDGECVFLVDPCYQCADGLQTVYNYKQEKVCEFGGITDLNTCEDFFENASNEWVIWDNVTPESLLGVWHMSSHACCLLSPETFERGEVVWWFLNNGTVSVTITIDLPTDSQLPITSEGSFEYEFQAGQLTVNNIRYDYRIESGRLVLSDSPESDGPLMQFVK